ncbi:MAG: cytochrome c family protein [Ignavibacteriales bacterium]|nr:cytochrome c family protein [Ignavibacteriales bacterium]
MNYKTSLLVLIIVAAYLFMPTNTNAQAKFVGSKTCGMCHKSEKQGQQLKIWSESKHAQAYKVLLTPQADEIAMKKGGKKAAETPECLKCHVGEKALVESTFKEDGVQCETCHGAGSEYKTMSVMKNKEEAIKKGLTVPEGEKFCKTCHNSASPTFKEFKYAEMWKKIAHATPKG